MSQTVTFTLPSRRTLGYALFGGFIHLITAGMLWFYFGLTTKADLIGAYIVIGVVLLGGIPATLLVTKQLITPSLVVAGALTVSAYGTWAHYLLPISTPYRTTIDSTLLDWYLLGWFIVVIVALAVGGGEYRLRYRRNNSYESESPQIHR